MGAEAAEGMRVGGVGGEDGNGGRWRVGGGGPGEGLGELGGVAAG